ncbi:MAG: hypothetical protein ABUS54_00155, partial [Actinomycetota bacterium]
MSPPRRRPPDPVRSGRRRRRRERTRRQQRRRTILLASFVGVPVAIVVALAVGGTVALGARCNLKALTPVAVGQ